MGASGESHRQLPETLPRETQIRGMRLAYIGQCFGSILIVLPVLSAIPVLYIKALGGTDVEAMLVSTIYAACNLLQIPISLVVPPRRAKRFMLRCWWIGAALSLVVVLVPSVLPPGRPAVWCVLGGMGAGLAFLLGGAAFWFPLLHDVVPDDERGRFFGKLRATWSTHLFLFTVLAGIFLGEDEDSALWKYQVIYLAAVLFSFVRNAIIARLPEAKPNEDDEEEFANWRRHVRDMVSRRSVRVFAGYIAVLLFCAGFLAIPMVLYMRALGFATRDNVVIYGFTTFGSIIALLTAGTLVDRWGTRRVFLLAHLILCGLAFAVIGVNHFFPGHARLLLTGIFVLSGGTMAAAGVATTAQFFHLAPERGRAFFLSMSNSLLYVTRAVAPLVAGLIFASVEIGWQTGFAGIRLSIYEAVFAGAGLALLAGTSLLYFLDDMVPGRGKAVRS